MKGVGERAATVGSDEDSLHNRCYGRTTPGQHALAERLASEAAEVAARRTTTLYRLFGADDALLYVGISGSPGRRFEQHAASKAWWGRVATIRLEHHSTRAAAEAAERTAIAKEAPMFNQAHADRRGALVGRGGGKPVPGGLVERLPCARCEEGSCDQHR